jgi:hypothetical protein
MLFKTIIYILDALKTAFYILEYYPNTSVETSDLREAASFIFCWKCRASIQTSRMGDYLNNAAYYIMTGVHIRLLFIEIVKNYPPEKFQIGDKGFTDVSQDSS